MEQVFKICLERGLKLHPSKCELVTNKVQFCGRIIDAKGIRFNPRQYEALTSMAAPTTVGALMELVHGANWMRTAIPTFNNLIQPLQDLLEGMYKKFGTRKKSRIANRPISEWEDKHQDAFQSLIRAITNQVTLSTQDSSKRLCLFTDASMTHWAGVLTQVDPAEIAKNVLPPQQWKHAPVAFVSGSFKGASSRWSTPEKECYAIVASVTRLAHILAACSEFSLFTDHKNILYMLSPVRFNANVARHIVHKTQRWAMRLSEFNFTIEHIPGENNIWADILTRWAAPGAEEAPARRVSAFRVPLITEEKPALPSTYCIATSQAKSPPAPGTGWKQQQEGSDTVWKNDSGMYYIPDDDEELQLRICVAAHCGLGGHRGLTSTMQIIKSKVSWSTMEADVRAFVQSCLVCVLSAGGMKVPRPLGQQVHAQRVSELLHFDFLYIGESRTDHTYILILKDDFSGYVFLRACKSADAETAASVLCEYFTTFVPVLQWFSDQGPHFCNKVMELLAQTLGAKHRFSTVYAPWSNGTVESVCKEVLRVMHALNTETRTPEADWPKSVPGIQSIINNSPARRLGGRAPVTVHTGMDSGNPLAVALANLPIRPASSIENARLMQTLGMERFFTSLDNMHRNVEEVLSTNRRQAIERHNSRTHVTAFKPTVGDYVVVARTQGPRTKMSTNWIGPRRVSRILSDFAVELEHLLDGSTSITHVCRIRPYADALVGTRAQMQEVAEFTDRTWHSVERFKDIKEEDSHFKILVSWKGLTSTGDSREPLTTMYEDVPTKVK